MAGSEWLVILSSEPRVRSPAVSASSGRLVTNNAVVSLRCEGLQKEERKEAHNASSLTIVSIFSSSFFATNDGRKSTDCQRDMLFLCTFLRAFSSACDAHENSGHHIKHSNGDRIERKISLILPMDCSLQCFIPDPIFVLIFHYFFYGRVCDLYTWLAFRVQDPFSGAI